MAHLFIRPGVNDVPLLARVLSGGDDLSAWVPDRLVVDAHVASAGTKLADVARRAGLPLVVDPQTFYLQDVQHADDAWARLPFASPAAHTPADFASAARLDWLVVESLDYQLAHGATELVPPYVHVESTKDGWGEVQLALWRRTRRYLDDRQLQLPVMPVLAVGWRVLNRTTWPRGLGLLMDGLTRLDPQSVAIAGSKVDAGVHPEQRLADYVSALRYVGRRHPAIAWQQGVLGEAAIAAGAEGYETGIGWRERCDLRRAMSGRRRPPGAGFGARPVYVGSLMRSIPKRSLERLLDDPRVGPDLVCSDSTCCPAGRSSLLRDARAHAMFSRARAMHELVSVEQQAWRWKMLATHAGRGLDLAARVNALSEQLPEVSKIDTSALRAIKTLADDRRQAAGQRAA